MSYDDGHSDYPHLPGSLYDCPACEAECFCIPGETLCVSCALAGESAFLTEKESRYVSRIKQF